MLQAAAMLVGMTVAWLLLTQSRWTPEHLAAAAGVGLLCVAVSAWLGGRRDLGAPLGLAVERLRRTPGNFHAALRTARAALAADVSLQPALILIKARPASSAVKAAFIGSINAEPGQIAVEADGDGLLAHVLDEESVEPHHLSALEDGVRAAFGIRAAQ